MSIPNISDFYLHKISQLKKEKKIGCLHTKFKFSFNYKYAHLEYGGYRLYLFLYILALVSNTTEP